VRGCDTPRFSLGLCTKHYARLRRGQPLDKDRPSIASPRRVVVVLPDDLYQRIQNTAEAKDKPASTFIRECLEERFP
jgi:hypothetical protein